MRTRDKSKAQLVKELKAMKAELSATLRREDAALDMAKYNEDALKKSEDAYGALYNTHQEMMADRNAKAQEVVELKKEVAELCKITDGMRSLCDHWKAEAVKMEARMKQMRRNFYQQAALAGELADNAFATVAPADNCEANRS